VVLAILDQQLSAEPIRLPCPMILLRQAPYLGCFLGTVRNQEWWTEIRNIETRTFSDDYFVG